MPRNVHKHIVSKDGGKYLNVTHIAGYGVESTPEGVFIGIKAYTSFVGNGNGNDEGLFIFWDSDADKVKRVFRELLMFLGNDSPYIDFSRVN